MKLDLYLSKLRKTLTNKSQNEIRVKKNNFIEIYSKLSLEQLNNELIKINNEFVRLPPSIERTERYRAVDTLIRQKVIDQENLSAAILQRLIISDIENEINSNIRYSHELKGSRYLTEEMFSNFCEIIKSLSKHPDGVIRIINEMIYEVRFGYLVNSVDKKPQSVSNALDICYNLYKKNNWRPTLIDNIVNLRKKDISKK